VEYQKHIDFSSSEKDKKILFSELVPKYLEFSKITKSKITHEGNVKHLKPLLEEFGNLRLDQITSERLEQFRLEFKPKGGKSWKPTTWRNRLGLLKQILDYGKNHGYKTADPFSTVKIPRPQIWEFEPRITTKEVITDFFSVLEPRYIPAAKIMRYTGLRPAELYRLTPDDIDYDKKIIIVRSTKSKTKRQRTIPIHKELTTYLGNIPLEINHISLTHAFQRACKKIGAPRAVTPYVLRHQFATDLGNAGVDVRTIQKLMGHTDIRMTVRYTNPDIELMREAVDVL
jgi:integrase